MKRLMFSLFVLLLITPACRPVNYVKKTQNCRELPNGEVACNEDLEVSGSDEKVGTVLDADIRKAGQRQKTDTVRRRDEHHYELAKRQYDTLDSLVEGEDGTPKLDDRCVILRKKPNGEVETIVYDNANRGDCIDPNQFGGYGMNTFGNTPSTLDAWHGRRMEQEMQNQLPTGQAQASSDQSSPDPSSRKKKTDTGNDSNEEPEDSSPDGSDEEEGENNSSSDGEPEGSSSDMSPEERKQWEKQEGLRKKVKDV